MNKITISSITFGVLSATTLAMAQTPVAPPMKARAAQSMPIMDTKAQMAQMDGQMNKMQALHEKMIKATTPEERRQVMEDQRKAMQESMGTMNPMMQGGGMMGGQGGSMMSGKAGAMPAGKGAAGDTTGQMQMMQKRMDMMQMMMQTMMDQQGMMGGPKGPDAVPKS